MCPATQATTPQRLGTQELRFDNKPFVKASTISVFHMPLNMTSMFARTSEAIQQAHAENGALLVLSRDDSAWPSEHLFAVTTDVPGAEMEAFVKAKGKRLDATYFFYTTCPRCAKHYRKNYVVGVAKVS